MNRGITWELCTGGKIYKFVDRNQYGERVMVQICKAKSNVDARGGGSRPKCWLSVTTLVTDRQGNIQEKYNPQIKVENGHRAMDHKWVLEPTVENTNKLLEQVEQLAFGSQ